MSDRTVCGLYPLQSQCNTCITLHTHRERKNPKYFSHGLTIFTHGFFLGDILVEQYYGVAGTCWCLSYIEQFVQSGCWRFVCHMQSTAASHWLHFLGQVCVNRGCFVCMQSSATFCPPVRRVVGFPDAHNQKFTSARVVGKVRQGLKSRGQRSRGEGVRRSGRGVGRLLIVRFHAVI